MLRKHFICQQACKQLDTVSFNSCFSFSSNQHNYETLRSRQSYLIKSIYRINRYGKYSRIASASFCARNLNVSGVP